jgi:16S rRNA (adenine1518-N6/adenine1519-N6)-dimethyltransferase
MNVTSTGEEIFDVVDAEDRILGQAPRSEVHARRLLHRAVHIFVFNGRGELLIHRRSATKDECPLKFTSSASGHLHAGEDYDTAAERELAEELSLRAPLQFLVKLPAGPTTSFEHSALYRTVTDTPPTFLADEILSGAFYPLEQIDAWVSERPDDFTPCFRSLWAWYRRGAMPDAGPLP